MADSHPVHRVRFFHYFFKHPVVDRPTIPPAERRLLRCRLMLEEVLEFCKASGFPVQAYFSTDQHNFKSYELMSVDDDRPELVDIVEAADALGDVNVVCNGSALEWGIPIVEVDAEIDISNLSKLGDDGQPVTDEWGKTVKGPRYKPPNIERVLREAGWDGVRWLVNPGAPANKG